MLIVVPQNLPAHFSQEITTLGFSQILKTGSGIDQTDSSLEVDQELGFLSHFSEEIEFSEIQLTVTCFHTFSSLLKDYWLFSRSIHLGHEMGVETVIQNIQVLSDPG